MAPAARRWVSAVALTAPFLTGFWVAAAEPAPTHQVVTTLKDPQLAEASGLAVVGDRWVSVNDSGDSARIFVIDPATGRTERTLTWGTRAVDVEAVAPAGENA